MPRRVITRFEMLADMPSRLGPKMPDGPYYHGTKAILDIGSVIEPRVEHYNLSYQGDESLGQYAFATRDLRTAESYARLPHFGLGQDRSMPGYVYEVEPLNVDAEMDPLDWHYSWPPTGQDYRSPSGWRVIRLVEEIPGLPKDEDDV